MNAIDADIDRNFSIFTSLIETNNIVELDEFIQHNNIFLNRNIINRLTVDLLKSLCRMKGWRVRSRMRKPDIVELVIENLGIANNVDQRQIAIQNLVSENNRLRSLASLNGIDANDFTTEELYILFGEKEPIEYTVYLNSESIGAINNILRTYEPKSLEKLLNLKNIPEQNLKYFLDKHVLGFVDSGCRNARIALWYAKIVIDSDEVLMPTSNPDLLNTVPNTPERINRSPEDFHKTLCIPRINPTTIPKTLVFDDILDVFVNYKPLTVRRAIGLLNVQLENIFPNCSAFDAWIAGIYSIGVDKRPHKIEDFNDDTVKSYDSVELPNVLINMLKKEGLSDFSNQVDKLQVRRNISATIDKLKNNLTKPTFILYPNLDLAVNTQSSYLSDFKTEVPIEQVYGFGVRDGKSPIKLYERDELITHFRCNGRFTDPITDEPFELHTVKRLYVLSKNDKSEEGVKFTNELNFLIIESQRTDAKTIEMIEKFKELKPEVKKVFETALKTLFEAGMYCRRWDGKSEYPITTVQTMRDIPHEYIQENVGNQLIKLSEQLSKLNKKNAKLFNDLPLKYFRGGDFVTSNDRFNGLTIGERIKIVNKGERVTSCLRMSSSWFIYSSMFWNYKFFGNTFDIDPNKLESIT